MVEYYTRLGFPIAFPFGEMAEWSKAPVLKTGDVKASVGSNPTLSAKFHQTVGYTRKYPSGRRGSPAKGVGCVKSVARVQIPPSAPKKKHPFGCFFFVGRDLKTSSKGDANGGSFGSNSPVGCCVSEKKIPPSAP